MSEQYPESNPTQFDELITQEQYTDPSSRIANSVFESASELHESMPELAGVTMFGSVVRGEAREDSDADICAFIELTGRSDSIQANPFVAEDAKVRQVSQGVFSRDVTFHDAIRLDYKDAIENTLRRHGVEESDLVILPISKDITAQQADYAVKSAEKWVHEGTEADIPRNIRGLFHAPVSDVGIAEYRKQVLDTFSAAEYGSEAWELTRRMVIGFERGREGQDFTTAHWRDIPETLQEAQSFYGGHDMPQ